MGLVTAVPTWSFVLDRKPPSMNDHSPNANTARFQYRKERDAWGWLLKLAMGERHIPRANERRRLAITRIIGPREREYDYDNLVGGCKALLDAMVKAGLVLNDNARWLTATYAQERGAASGVRVDVWEHDVSSV